MSSDQLKCYGSLSSTIVLCLPSILSLSLISLSPPSHADLVGLWITTECGRLQVSPGEIVVLPQGFRFVVDLPDGPSRGYVAEIFGTHFQLPDLGPIGASKHSEFLFVSVSGNITSGKPINSLIVLAMYFGVQVLMALLLQGIF